MWWRSSGAARPAEHGGGDAPHEHDVVGDQTVTGRHQVERHLALPDPALPEDEDAEAVHLDEVAVELRLGRQPLLEPRAGGADELARGQPRGEDRHAGLLGGVRQDRGRRRAVGDHEAGGRLRDAEDRRARVLRRERREIGHLTVAEDLDAVGLQLRQVAREREPRLLQPRQRDRTVEPTRSRHEPQLQARACRVEQLADRDGQYLASSSRMMP
jgi:hypothetical protein